MGINDAPLPGPILANPGMAENAAAFHGIRPHDIGVHDGQYRIDVARIDTRGGEDPQRSSWFLSLPDVVLQTS